MLIQCDKIISEDGEDLGQESSWLKVNKKYVVLAIRSRVHYIKRLEALIESENHGDPQFFDLSHFTIVTNHIPLNWTVNYDEGGCITFMPQSWFYDGFWDDLESEHPSAMDMYDKEKLIIIQEEEDSLNRS